MTDLDKMKITFDYDEETDILTISLGTGEPSYSEEIDDILLVDRGYFSGQVTGFQIMDVKHHGINKVQIDAFVSKAIKQERKQLESYLQQRTKLPSLIDRQISSDSRLKKILSEAV